jgi:Ca2+-binding EF-hand superfamily protein
MKNAVSLHGKGKQPTGTGQRHASLETCRLTCAELEWCVSAYLHIGDRNFARRIFAAIQKDGKDDVGLLELAPEAANLLSLVEFRRLLLERHNSLEGAFRELEEHLAGSSNRLHGRGGRTVPLAEFVKATAFFGLTPQQASHFFCVMDADGDGSLSFNEFLEALTQMPREVLLSDLRQRLLVKYPSVPKAFRDLPHAAGNLDREGFTAAVSRLGVVDIEAAEIFCLCDDDNSGDVCLEELQEAMRDVAPSIGLEAFWLRFAAEWPEIAAATRDGGRSGRTAAGALILEMLPEELQQICSDCTYSTCTTPEIDTQSATAPRASATRALTTLTSEAFDALAVLLDISKANASEIFEQIQRATSVRRRPSSCRFHRQSTEEEALCSPIGRREKHLVYAEDFLDQLLLWTENPCRRTPSDPADPNRDLVHKMVAPSRAAISVLKAELSSASSQVNQKNDSFFPDQAVENDHAAPQRLPKLPWRQSFSGRGSVSLA